LAKGNLPKSIRFPNLYLGSQFSEKEIEQALKEAGLAFEKVDNIEERIAKYLSEGKVVARFAGKMEYGPRALGNRSILYQPTDPTVNDWLNKKLKRTEFMPFAPVILKEKASEYFINFNKAPYAAEFMTITFDVTEKCKKEAPAIVHVDGTARPQVITEEINPSYYQILKKYEELTGLPILINTSFNIHEEPIVCSPYDAIRAFRMSKLDILAIGDFIVKGEVN
jgi:carbamoyltransferase